MELEDTHIDAYLKILQKHQRAYPTVYGSRVNILDSQFYVIFYVQTLLDHTWARIATGEDRKPPKGWSVLNHQWSLNDLMVVRGELSLGNRSWHDVDVVLIPCNLGRMHWVMASFEVTTGKIFLYDPFRQEVPYQHMNKQVACLKYLLPLMLHTVHFHRNRQRGDMTYKKRDGPFRMLLVSTDRVPQ